MACPGSRLVHLLYSHLRLAKEIQLNMWVRFGLAAAAMSGGRPADGAHLHPLARIAGQGTGAPALPGREELFGRRTGPGGTVGDWFGEPGASRDHRSGGQHVMAGPLQDRTVVITGAARGLGAALAHELARRGARLALLGHEGPELDALAATLPTPALAVEVDVTEARRQGQQLALLGPFLGGRRCARLANGLLGRRVPVGLLLQGLGEGVRPPVRRYVRDHWRHLLSS
ncbi:hypothetical protein SCANM63S_09092 [Streptomyces canarius]